MADNKSLLCDEEETKSFCFNNDDQNYQRNGERSDSEALILLLPCLSEDYIGWMLEREIEHLPKNDYLMRLRSGELDMSLRREALDWMFKACAHHSFGELCLYSAMNNLDRFLSVYSLPRGKIWAIQLVSVACLSLAAKFDEVNVPSSVDLQAGEPRFVFEGKTIQRMEILVLNTLKWNVKPCTPFNFIEYFLAKINGDDKIPLGLLIARSTRIILNTIKGIDFLEFKPSEIAAAVAAYVSGEIEAIDIDKALSSFIQEKGRVVKCLELIQDLISRSGSSFYNMSTTTIASLSSASTMLLGSCSPNGVLDAACLSNKSDERINGSCPSSSHTSPDPKRRKLEPENAIGSGS